MGQSRAKDLFDLTSTITDDSDSQFINLGGAIDQNINAMGIDDDPVSTIDLSVLNKLFNNVLAPTFCSQPSTSTKQLPPMLLQQQQPMLLPPPQQHLDHVVGTDGGLATGGRSNVDQRHVAVVLSLVGLQRLRARDNKELGSAGIVATAANRHTFRQQDDDHSSSARCQGEDDAVVGQGSASVSHDGAGGRRERGAAVRWRGGGGRERGRRGRRLRSQHLGHSALGQDFHARRRGDGSPQRVRHRKHCRRLRREHHSLLRHHTLRHHRNLHLQVLLRGGAGLPQETMPQNWQTSTCRLW